MRAGGRQTPHRADHRQERLACGAQVFGVLVILASANPLFGRSFGYRVREDVAGAGGRVVRRDQKRPTRKAARVVRAPIVKTSTAPLPVARALLAPPNDSCLQPDPAFDGINPTFTTTGAGTDGGVLPASCQAPGFSQIASDVWFEYTATCTGDLTVSLCSSTFDTKLAVYNGCVRCPTADPIACNDDSPGCGANDNRSRITTPVVKGDCYTIRVGGFVDDPSGTGTMVIQCQSSTIATGACCNNGTCTATTTAADCAASTGPWVEGETCPAFACPPLPPTTGACCDNGECIGTVEQAACTGVTGPWVSGNTCPGFVCPPPNDFCADAIEVFTDTPFFGTTVGAGGLFPSSCGGSMDPRDTWHVWRADFSGQAEFSTCGSSFDTTLAVFDACDGAELPGACNDDGCARASLLSLMVTAGTTYWIRVGVNDAPIGGASLPPGPYTLVVSSPPTACCFLGGGFQGGCLDPAAFPRTASTCRASGGTPFPRGSTCAGDSDGNGVDDLCEGLPDFDQNQDFDNADGNGNLRDGLDASHGGPSAVANALWWLDRKFPTLGVVPVGVTNVALIQDLAERMGTNGRTASPFGHAVPFDGTWLDDLLAGLRSYLNVNGLRNLVEERIEPEPPFESVLDHVMAGQHVTLLLGFYHVESVARAGTGDGFDVQWRRTGGHYVTVAAADSPQRSPGRTGPDRIAIGDPDADAAEEGDPGTVRGGDHDHDGDGDPSTSQGFGAAGYDHTKHNVETLASHDFLRVLPTTSSAPGDSSVIPGGRWLLAIADPAAPDSPPDPLLYGSLLAPFHAGSSGGAFDVPGVLFLSDSFLTTNDYPDPVVCQTYTVVEAAVIIGAAERQACCLTGGACANVSPVDCVAQGNTLVGPSTSCLGDVDGSATDDVCEACPVATIDLATVVPPDGTFDPRQPHEANSPLPRQGIGAVARPGSDPFPIEIALDPPVADAEHCFSLCETGGDPLLGPNSIVNVIDRGGGAYRIVLEHAVAAGAVTTIRYDGDGSFVSYVSHPANMDESGLADAADVTQFEACCLLGTCGPGFGLDVCDMDRSRGISPADLLRMIDMLGGNGSYRVWNATPLPSIAPCP